MGSTLVEPLLRAWIDQYRTLAPDVVFRYAAAGSPEAIDRLTSGDTGDDFYASDVPLTEIQEVTMGASQEIVDVPWAASAIAVAYNLPDLPGLHLSPDTVAGIFAGKILHWDDVAIKADNDGVKLPSTSISVVSRSDPSGTTKVFSSYLSAAAGGTWDLGSHDTVRFPRGTSAAGSSGVAAAVKKTTGAVGYVDLAHARQQGLGVAALGNRAGRFVDPTPDAVNAALAAANTRPFGTTAKLLFTPDSPGAYPLSTLSYLLFRRHGMAPDKAAALRHFAVWALGEGQRLAEPLGYTPVPRQLQVLALDALSTA